MSDKDFQKLLSEGLSHGLSEDFNEQVLTKLRERKTSAKHILISDELLVGSLSALALLGCSMLLLFTQLSFAELLSCLLVAVTVPLFIMIFNLVTGSVTRRGKQPFPNL